MTAQELKTLSKENVLNFVRETLAFTEITDSLRHINKDDFLKEHRRFDMSGYEEETGQCTVNNMAILNAFAYLGIYNYTEYLFLDFYKGTATLYLKYWSTDKNLEFDFNGLGTSEIIYRIFELTIFSDNSQRRRI